VPPRGDDLGDLFYLTILFGVWLAVGAIIVSASVRREAGGKRLRTSAVGAGFVTAYLSVALPALLFDGYSIVVAAFAVASAIQGAHFWLSMVRARRLRLAASPSTSR
jgi:hypothetical protein